MEIKLTILVLSAVILANVWTIEKVYAKSQTITRSADTYLKIERQYVNATGSVVEARCETGDTLLNGSCVGENRFSEGRFEHGIYLEREDIKSESPTAAATPGIGCKATLVNPQQTLRVETAVLCQRAPSKG